MRPGVGVTGRSVFLTPCINAFPTRRLFIAERIGCAANGNALSPAPARSPRPAFSASSRFVGCPCIAASAGPCSAPAVPSLNASRVTACAVCGRILPPALSAFATALSARCKRGEAATKLSTALYGAAIGPAPTGAPDGTERVNPAPRTSATLFAVGPRSGRTDAGFPPLMIASGALPTRETNCPTGLP
ncbi:hypothetical protein D3C76_1103930 [compost metagenome]